MELPALTHVAMLPSPGMGHLIPLVELATKLVHDYNLFVTFIIPTTDGSPMKLQKQVLEDLPKTNTNSIFLPQVSFDDLPEDTKIETRIALTMTRSLPAIHQVLTELTNQYSTRLSALIVDGFGTLTFNVVKELGISPYILRVAGATSLTALLSYGKLDRKFSGEYRDLIEPVQLFTGCVPVNGSDLPDPFQDRKNDAYLWMLKVSEMHALADGIIINSFLDLEPAAFKALQDENLCKPPVYPIGPMVRTGSLLDESDNICIKWLNKQPKHSVLFVSFGSGGTLSNHQLNDLALGLEMSKQRFLWTVKSPREETSNASYFNAQTMKDPYEFLPKGFINRTKGLGLVVSSWVPQVQILSHGSIGGFLTHCGWNSVLESMVYGVPMIAWPLFAEQRLNAVILAEDLKVALRIKKNSEDIVVKEDIAICVKRLIEGEEGNLLRENIKVIKDAAGKVLGEDGLSKNILSDVAKRWMN